MGPPGWGALVCVGISVGGMGVSVKVGGGSVAVGGRVGVDNGVELGISGWKGVAVAEASGATVTRLRDAGGGVVIEAGRQAGIRVKRMTENRIRVACSVFRERRGEAISKRSESIDA